MNLPELCDQVQARLDKTRDELRYLKLEHATKIAECLTSRPSISRRALTAVMATHYLVEERGGGYPTEQELRDLWMLLKQEIINAG